jgi:capsular polysaccharide biosynthesis protein
MDPNLTAIERAFQAAKSGEAQSLEDILRLLKREGYQVQYVDGLSVRRQLRSLMREAKALRARGGAER